MRNSSYLWLLPFLMITCPNYAHSQMNGTIKPTLRQRLTQCRKILFQRQTQAVVPASVSSVDVAKDGDPSGPRVQYEKQPDRVVWSSEGPLTFAEVGPIFYKIFTELDPDLGDYWQVLKYFRNFPELYEIGPHQYMIRGEGTAVGTVIVTPRGMPDRALQLQFEISDASQFFRVRKALIQAVKATQKEHRGWYIENREYQLKGIYGIGLKFLAPAGTKDDPPTKRQLQAVRQIDGEFMRHFLGGINLEQVISAALLPAVVPDFMHVKTKALPKALMAKQEMIDVSSGTSVGRADLIARALPSGMILLPPASPATTALQRRHY